MSAIILQFPSMDDAPNRIRKIRLDRKLTQQQLADRIAVSKMTVSDLERGKINLHLDYMRRIAAVFGVTPVDLLNDDDQNEFLRAEEMELVRLWRAADPMQRELIHRVAEPREAYRAGSDGADADAARPLVHDQGLPPAA